MINTEKVAQLGEVAEPLQAGLAALLPLGLCAGTGDELGELRVVVGQIGDEQASASTRRCVISDSR